MEQIQSTLSAKNQTVIPTSIRHALGVKAGAKLTWQIISTPQGKQTLLQAAPANWTKAGLGLGSATWKNTDVTSYLNSIRDEWPA